MRVPEPGIIRMYPHRFSCGKVIANDCLASPLVVPGYKGVRYQQRKMSSPDRLACATALQAVKLSSQFLSVTHILSHHGFVPESHGQLATVFIAAGRLNGSFSDCSEEMFLLCSSPSPCKFMMEMACHSIGPQECPDTCCEYV